MLSTDPIGRWSAEVSIPWRDVQPEMVAIMCGITVEQAREWVEPHIIRGEN